MFILKLAIRNLLRQKRRSLLTMLSMIAGYSMFSLSIAMAEGGYGNIIEMFTRGGTGHAQIHAGDYLERPSLYKNFVLSPFLQKVLNSHSRVESYASRVHGAALAFNGDRSSGVRVTGIDAPRESATTTLASKVQAGRLPRPRSRLDLPADVLIGNGLARLLRVAVGDEVVLVSQGADGSIANDLFTVCGILKSEVDSTERVRCYLALADAQEFLALGERIHEIALLLPSHRFSQTVCYDLEQKLAGHADLRVAPWEQVEALFYRSMQADKAANSVVLIIIVMIVGLGVLNTVLMSIFERTREFGVLRAMGTRPRSVIGIILAETLVLATLSCGAGAGLAALFNWPLVTHGIHFSQPLSVGGISYDAIKSGWVLQAFTQPALAVFLTAAVTCLPPALRASRIKPASAMRTY